MPRNTLPRNTLPRKGKSSTSEDGSKERDGYHLTSGDMARLLHVDLKTIHNWVSQGHMQGRRTKGRHLRFDRVEVVSFMREYGYPIPQSVGAATPCVVVDSPKGAKGLSVKTLQRALDVVVHDSLFGCALEVASGAREILVLDLDKRDSKAVLELLRALASRAETRGVAVVGVSRKGTVRKAFLNSGGSVALPPEHEPALRATARWLTGGAEDLPEDAELPALE